MKPQVFILFPLMGTEKVKSYQHSISGREVLFTSFLPRPKALYHMKHTQSGINMGGITATQKCLDLFLCTFQLFIVTRMFNGLIETNRKSATFILSSFHRLQIIRRQLSWGHAKPRNEARLQLRVASLSFLLSLCLILYAACSV